VAPAQLGARPAVHNPGRHGHRRAQASAAVLRSGSDDLILNLIAGGAGFAGSAAG
jgi:hypothetical protein